MLSCRMVLFMYAVSLFVCCETMRELIEGIRAESNSSDVAEPVHASRVHREEVPRGGAGLASESEAATPMADGTWWLDVATATRPMFDKSGYPSTCTCHCRSFTNRAYPICPQ